MSRQPRDFEREPFIQHEMDRHNFVSSGAPKERTSLLKGDDRDRNKKRDSSNCCDNITFKDIILCRCIWNLCDCADSCPY